MSEITKKNLLEAIKEMVNDVFTGTFSTREIKVNFVDTLTGNTASKMAVEMLEVPFELMWIDEYDMGDDSDVSLAIETLDHATFVLHVEEIEE